MRTKFEQVASPPAMFLPTTYYNDTWNWLV